MGGVVERARNSRTALSVELGAGMRGDLRVQNTDIGFLNRPSYMIWQSPADLGVLNHDEHSRAATTR